MRGYRWYNMSLHDDKLRLKGRMGIHDPGVVAVCKAWYGNDHPSPNLDCHCGYYSFLSPISLADTLQPSLGHNYVHLLNAVVWAHGVIIVHEEGLRSQYLRVQHIEIPRCICGEQMVLASVVHPTGFYSTTTTYNLGTASMQHITAAPEDKVYFACPQIVGPAAIIDQSLVDEMLEFYSASIIQDIHSFPPTDPNEIEGEPVIEKPEPSGDIPGHHNGVRVFPTTADTHNTPKSTWHDVFRKIWREI